MAKLRNIELIIINSLVNLDKL